MLTNESLQPSYQEMRSLFGNENFESGNNSTRESALPINMGIAKILSEDKIDEELAEELPEVPSLHKTQLKTSVDPRV